jgi:hypothetical protein
MFSASWLSAWCAHEEQKAIAEMQMRWAQLHADARRASERDQLRAKILAEHRGLVVIDEAPLLLEASSE